MLHGHRGFNNLFEIFLGEVCTLFTLTTNPSASSNLIRKIYSLVKNNIGKSFFYLTCYSRFPKQLNLVPKKCFDRFYFRVFLFRQDDLLLKKYRKINLILTKPFTLKNICPNIIDVSTGQKGDGFIPKIKYILILKILIYFFPGCFIEYLVIFI